MRDKLNTGERSRPKKDEKYAPDNPEENTGILKDSATLLKILPEEIWLKVLEKLEPDDLQTASNASQFLRHLLKSQRVLFLFPKVWQQLAARFEHVGEFRSDFSDEDSDPDTEYDYPTVSGTDADSDNKSWETDDNFVAWFRKIIKLRKVCLSWCQGIDQFYQNLPQLYKMMEEPSQQDLKYEPCFFDLSDEQVGEWALGKLEFSDYQPDFIEEFMQYFESTHGSEDNKRSPFIVRDVTLTSRLQTNQNGENPNHVDISTILQKYGKYIWYCNLYADDNYPSRLAYYRRVQNLLSLMPNLKVLYIRYNRNTKKLRDPNGRIRYEEQYPTQEENVQLQAEMEVNGLPKLKDLKLLKTKNLPVAIFNELICKNAHLQTLQVQRASVHENYDIYTVEMPNLKKLYMEYYTEADFQKLGNPSVNLDLDSLYLDFDDCPFFEWPGVFRLVEQKWGSKLTDMRINLPQTEVKQEENRIMQNCSGYQFKMEKLKRLRLLISNYTSLDFVLPLKNSLEILDVKVRCDFGLWSKTELGKKVHKEQKLIMMDLMQKKDKQKKPNIFELMPKLKFYKVLVTFEHLDGRTWYPGKGYPGCSEYYRSDTRESWLETKQ